VLVETFEEGELVSRHFFADMNTRKRISKLGLTSILQMVFTDNFVHADLHPGNVLFRPGRTPELVLLDAGLTAQLGPVDRANLVDLFHAVIRNDGRLVGQLMRERASGGSAEPIAPADFDEGMAALVAQAHAQGLGLGDSSVPVNVSLLLRQVLSLCRAHRVCLEPRFVSIVVAISVAEGLGRRLDPDLDVLELATPFILKASLRQRQGEGLRIV
jgi:aarF domain-containing kinase